MKRSLGIAVALISAAFTSAVWGQVSVQGGYFGVTRVEIPPAGGVSLVAFNFTSNEPLTLEDVFGDQLVSSTRAGNADKVYIWNGTEYDNLYQKPDGFFYDILSGERATNQIAAGTAMFLQSPSSAATTNTITLSGSVLLADSSSQSYNVSLTTIANPYPTELDLNDPSWDWSLATANNRAGNADKVYIWNAETANYDAFYLDATRTWQVLISDVPDPVIPIGGGAFYEAQSDFDNSIFRTFTIE